MLGPAWAGHNPYLTCSIMPGSFSHSTETGTDKECLAAWWGTCCVLFVLVRAVEPSLDPFGGWPWAHWLPGWIQTCRSVGDFSTLWLVAVVLGPISGTSSPVCRLLLSPSEVDH